MSKHKKQLKGFPQFHLPGLFTELEIAEADRVAPAYRKLVRDLLQDFDMGLSAEQEDPIREARNRDYGQSKDTPRV